MKNRNHRNHSDNLEKQRNHPDMVGLNRVGYAEVKFA